MKEKKLAKHYFHLQSVSKKCFNFIHKGAAGIEADEKSNLLRAIRPHILEKRKLFSKYKFGRYMDNKANKSTITNKLAIVVW